MYYWIVLYPENQSQKEPFSDMYCYQHIDEETTINDFINAIVHDVASGNKNFDDFDEFKQYLDDRKHRETLSFSIGRRATETGQLHKTKVKQLMRKRIVSSSLNSKIMPHVKEIKHDHNECLYLIGGLHRGVDSNKKADSISSVNVVHLLNSPPDNKSNKKRKRNRGNKRKNKRRKMMNIGALAPGPVDVSVDSVQSECMWLLVDVSPTMTRPFCSKTTGERTASTTRMDKARESLQRMVQDNWMKDDTKTHRIALYSFAQSLFEEIEPLEKSMENVNRVLKGIEVMKIRKKQPMPVAKALEHLIEVIGEKKSKMDYDIHRIVLFCGRHKSTGKRGHRVKRKVKESGVMVECVMLKECMLTDIKTVCRMTNGRLWTPSVNEEEWNGVVTEINNVSPVAMSTPKIQSQ